MDLMARAQVRHSDVSTQGNRRMRSGGTALGCACNVWILQQSEHCMVQGVYGVVSPMVVSFAHFVCIFLLEGLQHSRIPIYTVVRSD